MDVALVTFKANGVRISIPLKSASVIVGRGDECAVRVPAASVSRQHCELINDGEHIRVKDMNSANGTFVNGERMGEGVLAAGDRLTVGHVNFVVRVDGEPARIERFDPIVQTTAAEEGVNLADLAESEAGDPAEYASLDDSRAEREAEAVSLDGLGEPESEDPLAALEMLADDDDGEDDDPLA
ncbi:MAG: FHA domain-containing protein [Planctomycetota bacterium]|jgi:pSer/pThr/pTyr-binding forkhead associated (FHA) protein